jgi:superkiller protein 3
MLASKAVLKAIGASIKSQKYDEAVEQAQKLLASEPQNYQG